MKSQRRLITVGILILLLSVVVQVAVAAVAIGGSGSDVSSTQTTHVGSAAVPANVHACAAALLSAWLSLTQMRLSVVLSTAAAPAIDAFAPTGAVPVHAVPLSVSTPSVLRT